ncbi:DNA adenine methylase [Pectobacterium polonicum]|uniref:site-specific DNA-methyltransferase (adenine-specific) n=1 Tax=Pectobacterium polonicum TaxID=2485124 RepID=A0ABV1PC50_9GAMM
MGYLGSKAVSGAYQKIISNMPPHDTYIETHLGSGAIMFYKPLARHMVGIDIDDNAFLLTRNRWKEKDLIPPDIHFHRGDAVSFLDGFFDFTTSGRVLIYADPPYLPETRTSRARYRYEYTVADHERLLACLMSLPANVSVILSGYPSRLYDETLAGWRSMEFQAMTRGGVRTEKIWMNYPEGAAYSAAFAGKDYIDRQRIKRKAARWAEKYRAMSHAERLAVMAELMKVDVSN